MTAYRFDWQTAPLTENDRLHWQAKRRIVKDVRLAGKLATRQMGPQRRIEVTLVWVVKDKRKRDEDNIVPTLKALCDGIVDAGVVPDDTPVYMIKHMPIIRFEPKAVPHFELEVTPLA
jgi:Holliday junction resolvase RusA-like endonuclease